MRQLPARWRFVVFYIAGFISGIIYVNIFASQYINQSPIFSEYFLKQYSQMNIISKEYILYLLELRMVPFLCLLAIGYTRFRKIAVVVCWLWTGFSCGLIISVAIMSLGLKGIFVFLLAIFPQFAFYLPSFLILLFNMYFADTFTWSWSKASVTLFLLVSGILTEGYINPVIMRWI